MLSFNRGKPIADIYKTDGTMNKPKKASKVLKIFGKDDFSDKQPSDIVIPQKEYSELFDNDFYKENKINRNKRIKFDKIINGELPKTNLSLEMREAVETGEAYIANKLKTMIDMSETDEDMRFFPIPQKKSERIYVPAPSGSGKSTFIGLYLKELRKISPKRKIFIFSRVDEDKPLDAFKNTFRIPLRREVFEKDPLEIQKFKDGIMIFDDIDTILDKALVKYIRNFRDDVLETGRHYGITIISTSHIITNFLATRTLINEANAIVLFPKGSSFYAVSNFLERYMGFSKKQIRDVEKLKTRWIWFWKEYPKYAIYERGAFIF